MRGGRSKKEYLNFDHAFGHHKHILIHQAVWMADEREMPMGWELDHINGDKRDNSLQNLRVVTRQRNCRDGGFLTMLRNRKINPARIERTYLLRYFDRMAVIKPALSPWKYRNLLHIDMQKIIYLPHEELQNYLRLMFNIQIEFNL